MKKFFFQTMQNNFQKRFFYLFLSLISCSLIQLPLYTKNTKVSQTRRSRAIQKRFSQQRSPRKQTKIRRKGHFSKTLSKFIPKNLDARKRSLVLWHQKTPMNFNELIFSWNAFRPTSGAITFWVSVKHSSWSPWHRLAQWGSRDQRTFVNKRNSFVHTKHVRVEMQRGRMAKQFRIKATFSGTSSVKNVKALFACISNSKNFREPTRFNKPSTIIRNVPHQSQMELDHKRSQDLCSPTSLSIVTHYFMNKLYGGTFHFREIHDYVVDFAEKVHDNGYLDIYGNWILNVAEAYQASQGDVFYRVERMNSFNELYGYLTKKIPIAVSVRKLKGGATPYANGHFVVVVGWDKKKQSVICIDPAFKPSRSTVRAYNIKDFLKAWGLSRNLSYVPLLKQVL